MSKFYALECEVAGGLGPHTVLDRAVHPPVVSRLHYVLDDWLGDEILESFPSFIVTEGLAQSFKAMNATGMDIGPVEVSTSEEYQARKLPRFVWLKVTGKCNEDDFGLDSEYRLVVSERVLEVVLATGPTGLSIEPVS